MFFNTTVTIWHVKYVLSQYLITCTDSTTSTLDDSWDDDSGLLMAAETAEQAILADDTGSS